MRTTGDVQARAWWNPLAARLICYWNRLPVVVRAVLGGFILSAAGTAPWAILVSANFRYRSDVPWAVAPAALYLWAFWRFASGAGWPKSTAEARRILCRANSPPAEVWGMALIAGVLGLTAVVLLQGVMARLVTLPQQHNVGALHFPFVSLLSWVLMGSMVAGVVEETSFRGYMQGPIERRHGPFGAILLTGFLFGLAHFTHPEVGLSLMPYYMAVAAVYGTLAYLTNSIFPGMVLHAGGNILSALALFGQGRSEWQASADRTRLIWDGGPDASFWIAVVAFLIAGGVAVGAYFALARVAQEARQDVLVPACYAAGANVVEELYQPTDEFRH